MSAALLGAKLRRVDAPFPDLLALSFSSPTLRGVLLIGLAAPARGVGFTEQRPAGQTRSPFLLRARSCLEGGRLVDARWLAADRLTLTIERTGQRHVLEAVLRGTRGNALLRAPSGELVAALHPHGSEGTNAPGPAEPGRELGELGALRIHAERMLDALGVSAFERRKLALLRALRAGQRRLERRLSAIEGDRARADRVPELRRHAGLLLTNLHALGEAAGQVEVRDESVDPPALVALEIDPTLGARRQADAWFSAARKLERGAALAEERAQATRSELARLHALFERVTAVQEAAQLGPLLEAAHALAIAVDPANGPGAPKKPQERLPYRRFMGSGARAILVGKGAADNDKLTLEHARPHDLWLHARDDAGAHVVVPLERGEACPPELLCDAATLAAHFSQARGQARVDVLYTERRYVRKPRKVGPGKVALLREKVFRLQLQPQRLQRLLAAER
jgi:predicted ribosome quality control (RQC) complex YloA/Tae2 family protein